MRSTLWLVGLAMALPKVHDSTVWVLDDGNFDQTDEGEWAIDFYAPWCKHCKDLEPIWKAVAKDLKMKGSTVNVAKVDCVLNPSAAKENNVRGFPTIRFIRNGKTVSTFKKPQRNKGNLVKWILENSEAPLRVEGKVSEKASGGKKAPPEAKLFEIATIALTFIRDTIRRVPFLACITSGLFGVIVGAFVGVTWALGQIKKHS